MANSSKSSIENQKYKKEIEKQKYLLEMKDIELSIKEREKAISILDTIEANNINNKVVDSDLASGWVITGQRGRPTKEDYDLFYKNAYLLYHTNPHAKTIIRGLVKFVLGKGPTIVPRLDNDEEKTKKPKNIKKKIKKIWNDFRKQNKFNIREKEILTRLFRDGEVFNRIFKDTEKGEVAIRFIRPDLIGIPKNRIDFEKTAEFGIKTDPDDIETPISYIKMDNDGNFKEEIPAEDVEHLKINCDADEKRGITIFKVVAKRLKQYEEWLEDRIVLNKIRSAIALVKEVETGNVGTVKNIRDANLSSRFGSDKNVTQAFDRGTVITASKGIKYNLLSPNINAADVKDDGRAILLAIAAGVGFPEMIFTADYGSTNYASTLVAQNPWVREIEDWQDYLKGFYERLYEIVIQTAIDAGKLPENTSTECDVEFPPMIAADLDALAKAYETLYKFRVISKKTWQLKMGLDNEEETLQIAIEDSENGGMPDPNQIPPGTFNPKNAQPGQLPSQGNPGGQKKFNLPMTPVNQYGAAFREALKNNDMEKVSEIIEKIEYLFNEEECTEK